VNESAHQRSPGKLNDDLVGDAGEFGGKALDTRYEEQGVLYTRSLGSPGTGREGIRARVDGDREGRRLRPRAVQGVAAVTGANVHEDVAESGG
jgi:hypothetical protein